MATSIERGWRPQRTWVMVVGTLEWKHADLFAPFPKERRRDALLVRFFQDAGVPADQIVYLKDAQATDARVAEALEALLPRSSPGDLLFFYYCGHGYQLDSGAACFSPYNAGDEGASEWLMADVPRAIERHFRGDLAILAADCCYAGSLAGAVQRRKNRVSYACLASSSASELSTGNWTFTETLLAGLHGHAFTNTDGGEAITLAELAEEILGDMAFAEEQLATFVTTGAFDPHLVVAAARPRPHPQVGRRVEVRSEGEWYKARIIDARGDQLRVHYYGWDDVDDEWVGADQIRDMTPTRYPEGAQVEVRWKGEWYPATVLHVRGGIHYIAYDGYSADWNEWVASSRLRLPST